MLQKRKIYEEIIPPKNHSHIGVEVSELRNSNERFLVITDPHGRILFADPAFVRSTGRTVSEVVGFSICEILSQDHVALLSDRIAKVVSTGMPENFEIVKGARYTENSLFPLCDGEGTIVQLALVATDITARKQAERVQAASHSLLAATLESPADGLLVVDLSDPSNPQPMGSYLGGAQYSSVAVAGHYAVPWAASAKGFFRNLLVTTPLTVPVPLHPASLRTGFSKCRDQAAGR